MTKTNTDNAAFGERAGGLSGETIRRYRTGERSPDLKKMALIFQLTDGEVTPNDWVGVGARTEHPSSTPVEQQP